MSDSTEKKKKKRRREAEVDEAAAEGGAEASEGEEQAAEGSEEQAAEGGEEQAAEGSEEAAGEGGEEAAAEGGEEGAGEGAEASEEAAEEKPNRKERRRRKKRKDGDDEPKDRNAKVRQKIMKQRAEAEAQQPEGLSTGEMIDDAVARGLASAGKWAKANSAFLQALATAVFVGGIGWGVYYWYTSGQAEGASAVLMAGVSADRGRVAEEGQKRDDEEDIYPSFRTDEARMNAALEGYRKAKSQSPGGSAAAILARLGEAGVLLDKRQFDEALTAYREVKASPLAAADGDVRGRSMEGIGFALEGKGDLEGAAKAFHELESVGLRGYTELSMYHQARIAHAKGEKDKALGLIKTARERLQTNAEGKNYAYLRGVLDELHKTIDPTSAPKQSIGGADKQMSVEEMMQLQQQLLKLKEKAGKQDEH